MNVKVLINENIEFGVSYTGQELIQWNNVGHFDMPLMINLLQLVLQGDHYFFIKREFSIIVLKMRELITQ